MKFLIILSCILLLCVYTEIAPKTSKTAPELQKELGKYSAMNKLEKIKEMLEQHPSLVHSNINGKHHERPLHWAVLNGKVEVVIFLLNHKAEVDAQDSSGMTPLHWAAWQDKVDVAKSLVSRDADINKPDKYNRTPLDRAINDDKWGMVLYLQHIGAKKFSELSTLQRKKYEIYALLFRYINYFTFLDWL